MSPLPFLFKQQLKYYTSHFAQPLPSFSKEPTNQPGRQTNKQTPTKKPYQTKPAIEKTSTNKQLYPLIQNYALLLPPPLLFLPSKFNIFKMLDHSPFSP